MTQETNKAAVTDQNFVETVKDYVIEKVTGQGWKQDFKTDKSNPRRLTSVKVASNDIEVLQSLHAAAVGIFAAQVGEIVKGQINMKTLKPYAPSFFINRPETPESIAAGYADCE